MASLDDLLSSAIQANLAQYMDEDILDYIESTLSQNPDDEDAREAVEELLRGSIEEDDIDVEDVITNFFQQLNLKDGNDNNGDNTNNEKKEEEEDDGIGPMKLKNKVLLKEHDIQSYASGLSAQPMNDIDHEDETNNSNRTSSTIASFYANMIDISQNEAAISERKRRKERQKAIRNQLEEAERNRALQEAMDVLQQDDFDNDNEKGGGGGGVGNAEEMLNAASDNSADVHLKNFDLPNLRGGGPDLLQNASLTLAKGRRYGLMGRNGCGKTTFMTFLAQRQISDAIPKKMSMMLVRQETIGNELSALEMVLKSDVKREGVKRFITYCEKELERLENGGVDPDAEYESKEQEGGDGNGNGDNDGDDTDAKKGKKVSKGRQKLLEKKKEKLRKAARAKANGSKAVTKVKAKNVEYQKTKLSEKLGKAYQKLAEIEEEEGGDPEPKALRILTGMGFSIEMYSKPTSELSGGWRMRVSIACGIFANPALLLLDEPTNHLDLETCLWLERYLTNDFTGTLLVVSHDRHFLNEVVTDVVYFNKSTLTSYRGDITNFEAVRDDEKQRQLRLRENQEAKKAHLQKYIDLHSQAGENGPKASRQRKSKMKKLEKVGMMNQEGKRWKASYDGDADEVEEFVEDEKVTLIFPDPGSFDGEIVKLDQVTFGYNAENILLNKVDLSINLKSRVALLGRNGQGKSTLIKLVIGALQPMKGQAKVNGRAKIEYLAQHQFEELNPDSTPISTMIERYPGDSSNQHILALRRHLANFGLGGEVLPKQRIYTMSGGQKCRLCLASAMYRRPHLLVLDEPTNHLDFETIEALIEGITDFNGGVLIVSHDQHLLTSVCDDLYVVDSGSLDLLRHGHNTQDAFEQYKKDVVSGKR